MRTFTLSVALLAAMAAWARAEDDDPEPQTGATVLRKLKGTWTASRFLSPKGGGKMGNYSWTFDGDKMTYATGGRTLYTATITPGKTRRDAFTLKRDNANITTRYFFEVKDGELFLTINTSTDPKAKPDFSGNTTYVSVFTGEKK